jgi:hypothetical protein
MWYTTLDGQSFSKVEHVRRKVRGGYQELCIHILFQYLSLLFKYSRNYYQNAS